jgi:hypothetical protein
VHVRADVGLVADTRKNAAFLGVMLAIALTGVAMMVAVGALLARM